MKKLLTLLLALSLFSFKANAQKVISNSSSSGQFFLTIGIENRITPIHINSPGFIRYVTGEPSINEDKHLSGTALALGLNYQLSKPGTTFTLEYAARYDYLYEIVPINPQIFRPEKGWFSDIHLRIFQPLRLNNFILKPGVGYSIMNRGTECIFYDGQRYWRRDLRVNPFDISIGTEIKNVLVDVRCYFIEEMTEKSAPLIILPEIKLAYRIGI